MTALTDALDAAQAKALAALEKAYVRGTLDAEAFTERLNEIGCTDAIDQGLLIAALDTLKEHGATEPTYTERRNTEKPTDAQRAYIERLAREHEIEPPDLAGVTRVQASEIIDSVYVHRSEGDAAWLRYTPGRMRTSSCACPSRTTATLGSVSMSPGSVCSPAIGTRFARSLSSSECMAWL